jgi:steroid delta-isomerase
MTAQQVLEQYLALWCDPSPGRDLTQLDQLAAERVRFKDPIQELHGRARLKAVFAQSSKDVADPRVTIDAIAWVDPRRALIRWQYSGTIRRINLRNWSVMGMSDIQLDEDQRIASHEDFWDLAGGLFEHFPLIGGLFRRLRQRLRLHQ